MTKKSRVTLTAIAATLFSVAVVYVNSKVDLENLFTGFSTADLSWVLFLGLLFHLSFGVIMWVGFWLQYDLKLKPIEILTLPLMMHLFLYLMPIKGGMLFQVFYSKHKYGLDMSKGFALGTIVFIALVILTVTLGLFLSYFIPVDSVEIRTTLWLMGLGLVGMVITLSFLPKEQRRVKFRFIRLIGFLINVRTQLSEQFRNPKLFAGLFFTTFISVIIQAILFWQTGEVLGTHANFLPMLLVVLILRIILLVRLLPGNLGLQEIMIGATFAAAGLPLHDGLMIGIVTRLISVFWSAVIGLPALYSNLKYFDVKHLSFSKLIQKVSRSE